MKNIVLIGDTDSFWLKFYIQNLVLGHFAAVTVLSIRTKWDAWYQDNKVEVIAISFGERSEKETEEQKTEADNRRRDDICDRFSHIDVLQVHFCAGAKMYCYKKLIHKSDISIMTYWGSDLLRASMREILLNEEAVKRSDWITVISSEMKRVFLDYYGAEVSGKCKVIDFGDSCYDEMNKLLPEGKAVCKEYWGLYPNKKAVMVGYNGLAAQQHKKVLEQIAKMPSGIKNTMMIIIHLGYAIQNEEYHAQIIESCEQSGCEYLIIDKFLDFEEIAKLRMASDVFIHAQVTDALSSSVMEYLYAGAVLLNPSWIKYDELVERGISYIEYDEFVQLKDLLENVLKEQGTKQDVLEKNRRLIYEMQSWEAVRPEWLRLYGLEEN